MTDRENEKDRNMVMFKVATFLLTLGLSGATNMRGVQAPQEEPTGELEELMTDEDVTDFEPQLFQDRLLTGDEVAKTEFEEHLMLSRRTDENCAVNIFNIDLFDITVAIVPQSTQSCPLADQVFLGNAINLLLLDHGIGDAGLDDGALYLAGVCPEPTSTRRRKLQRGYIWNGGGGCTSCGGDDGDDRRSLSTSAWFTSQFKPQLESTVATAIAVELVPEHEDCLGTNPTIQVTVDGVSLWELNLSCSGGDPLLETTGHSIWNLGAGASNCGTCSKVDFSTFNKGDYVRYQYLNDFGLEITSSGGYSANGGPRVFDTSDPGTNNSNGDPDLGSPNEDCSNAGPGKGNGGEPGEEGENCIPIGNVLIIQESNKIYPDDNGGGGSIMFHFDDPVLVSDVGMMDIDETSQQLKFTYADGSTESYGYVGLGNNSVQRVICNKSNVVKMEIVLPGSGAVTELNFCQSCS